MNYASNTIKQTSIDTNLVKEKSWFSFLPYSFFLDLTTIILLALLGSVLMPNIFSNVITSSIPRLKYKIFDWLRVDTVTIGF